MKRLKIIVSGQVQGVGFRPFVFRIAQEHGLTGFVQNTSQGVRIEVQGSPASLLVFRADLQERLPPLARITTLSEEETGIIEGESGFAIISSEGDAPSAEILISPDTATCADCLDDIRQPSNRCFAYPFTNCTNCGPRYSIISALPYDRPYTTMSCFPMCEKCRAEYENPADRRFHAQPNACPKCGPEVWLTDAKGNEISRGPQAMLDLAQLLSRGGVAAIKGLGGFHLACNATNAAAVAELRKRKRRPAKPFAIMAAGLEAARSLVTISSQEQEALSSPQAPIVLCKKNPDSPLPEEIAPGLDRVGVMLPYTPLHHVLLTHLSAANSANGPENSPASAAGPAALVMTSGNHTDEPIAIGNREALKKLAPIADVFLLHNRDILIRADDSVVRLSGEGEYHFMRRARGFAPLPLEFALAASAGKRFECVLGVGAELKNTICFARRNSAAGQPGSSQALVSGFVSQHIGDITEAGTENFMRETAAHLEQVFKFKPDLIVRDLHPNYLSSGMAEEFGQKYGVPVLALQHHYAHAFSVLLENSLRGEALSLCLDGSGLGEDQSIWGGELILADTISGKVERIGHIAPTLTPGGDAAAKEPWRMAFSYMHKLGHNCAWFLQELEEESGLLEQILRKKINCPANTSTGRLFDAVAGLLGFGSPKASALSTYSPGASGSMSFEGQAAMWLEAIQEKTETQAYPCSVMQQGKNLVLNTLELFDSAYNDAQSGVPAPAISRRFHLGLAKGLCRFAEAGAQATGLTSIGLSGGVMHNATLSTLLPAHLREAGLTPLEHRLLPPGDGCISFGQAAWGMLMGKK